MAYGIPEQIDKFEKSSGYRRVLKLAATRKMRRWKRTDINWKRRYHGYSM